MRNTNKSRKSQDDVSGADLEALSARSASGRTVERLIKAGLAINDGCGGWYITLAGQRAASTYEAMGSPVCPDHGAPFEDGECAFCEHEQEYY